MVIVKKLVKRYAILLTVAILAVILVSYTFCKREDKQQVLVDIMMQALEQAHYSPMEINDSFSVKVYKQYLKQIDFSKLFLTKEDLKILEVYKNSIDDEVQERNLDFYNTANEILTKSVEKVQGYYTEILSKPFAFDGNETYQTDPEKRDFSQNDAALKEEWRKALQYQALTRVYEMLEAQEKAKAEIPRKTFAQLEDSARGKVKRLYEDIFKRRKQMSEMNKFGQYLNAIASIYDPHTIYMPPSEKKSFDIQLSGQFEGIGATLREQDNGYVKVLEIIPGSPSYLQGELKANDLILKVAQENQVPVDIYFMPIDDVVQMIRGKKGTKVTLNVRKLDGTIKDITITRGLVIVEETYAKSSVIDGPAGKTGYIYLPKFYANFERTKTGRSCAADIAKEIEKLKDEKVTGIILDLRNNTGGSLDDVVRMGGLFISKGPIVQSKTKTDAPEIMYDIDPAIQYSGPFVIMVNSLSASASEILAAAMQDYHRAIIIGSTTFGKGTVQTQINFDDFAAPAAQKFGELGGMLLTIKKFYRINGGATQLKGVTPDIALPDPFSEIETGEREQDYHMPWDKINPVSYTTWTGLPKFDQIVQKEKAAIDANPDFKVVKDQALELKKQRNQTIVALNLEKIKKQEKEIDAKSKKFEELTKKDYGLKIHAVDVDISEMKGDTIKLNRTNNWIKDLTKDMYLKEAVQVINLIHETK